MSTCLPPPRSAAWIPGPRSKSSFAFDPEAWHALDEHGLDRFTPDTPVSLELLRQQATVAREQGFYAAFGERNEDVGSISAPVFDHAGRLACAIGLGFPNQRIRPADVERLGPVVARAGLEANRALGYDGTHAAG